VEAVDASELQPDATSAGLSADVPREALLDALTCPISGKLFVDPVTATCGHTFSRRMLAKWMSQPGRQSSCPTCRAPLYHESPHQWPVNTTLVDLCERFLNDALRDARDSEPKLDFPPFDSQYRLRRNAASRGATSSGATGLLSETSVDERAIALVQQTHAVELPLFVLDPMVPGQEITLNVFEERYKRMVRRCMQHTRRFGMVAPADEHHEGATRAATTRERRRGEIPDRNPNPETEAEVIEAETEADAARVYASSEEEEDALESSGDRSRGVGRRVDPPAGPFAFLDHGVECVVTAFQEGIDGRVLVRCRATRHVKVLSAFEDEAGYAVARVVQVDDGFDGVSGASNPTMSSDMSSGAAIETEREANAVARATAASFVNLDESPADARGAAVDPLFWQTQLMGLIDGVARRRRNDRMDVTETRIIDARDACRLRLRLERAVGAHRVWLAHVAGRRLEPGSNKTASGGEDAEDAENAEENPERRTVPWSRGGSLVSGSRDYFRRSYGGKPENLLALSGERPRADRPEALAWWLARVANPLPPLGAALELRGAALSAPSVTRRFSRIYRGLVGSMRSVHGLAFEDFRGARPTAAATVAIAWCRAAEASARLETKERLVSAAASRDGNAAGRRRKNSKRAFDLFDDAIVNRHRFQFLVDSALRVFVESVWRYGEMDGEDGTGTGDGDAKDPAAWPAMRATPIPGYDPRGRSRRVDVDVDVDEDDHSRIRRHDRGRRRRHDPASTVLKASMRSRIAFLAAKGGAPCVAWALYRHLSRFSSDETFEFLARGIGFAIDPANDEFEFERADPIPSDRESIDVVDPHYNSYDTTRRVPFFPQDFNGSVPDDFPRPGDGARARRAVGAETSASKRAAVSLAFRGGGGATHSIVARVFFVARGVCFRALDLALTAFAWTVAGIGHLLVLVFVSAYAPLARFAGWRGTDARSNDANEPRVSATQGRRPSLVSFSPLEGLSNVRTNVDHTRVSSAHPPRDRASSLNTHPERSRLASGAFALICAAALFLVLDSENLARPIRA
jgi:Lon protease-like protein